MRSFVIFIVTYFSVFISHHAVAKTDKPDDVFEVFTGNAVASETPFNEGTNELEHPVQKRSSTVPRPTLQVEKADKVWCRSKKLLTVTYNTTEEVKCGKNYPIQKSRALFHDPPEISMEDLDESKLYTLVMLDPDAPDRKHHLARNWLHWLVVDIASNDFYAGNEIVDYEPPEPPPGTGAHRYVFLLLEQSGPSANRFTAGRTAFSIRRYAREHNLVSAVSAFTYYTTGTTEDKV